jgi:predicted ATP-grasp superfamily ATP-dependent carboligase
VIRNLRKHDIDVISLGSSPLVSACFTRYTRCIRLSQDPTDAPDLWLDRLRDIARRYGARPVLFPTSDATVAFLAEHRDELSDICIYRGPKPCIAAKIIDKGALHEAALRLGFLVPRTHIIRKYGDLDTIPCSFCFPCIIKPSQSHIWRKLNKPGKAIIVHDQADLRRQIISLMDVLSRIPLLAQEIIPGPESNLIYLVAYLTRQSQPLALFTARKLRQCPVDFGTGSLVISEVHPRAMELGIKLLQGLRYEGLAGVEFKEDQRDGELRLVEINPRASLLGEIAVGCGVEFPYIAYCDMVGLPVEHPLPYKTGVKWIGFAWDLFSFLEYRRRGEMTVWQWIRSLRGKKVHAYWKWSDPLPAAAEAIVLIFRINRSLYRQLMSACSGRDVQH